MKQYTYIDAENNLSRRVEENYDEITWEQVRPIVMNIWEWYMKRFGWTSQEIIEEYQKQKCEIREIAEFEYLTTGTVERYPGAVKIKERVAHMKVSVKGKEEWILCDQCLVKSQYKNVAGRKVLEGLLMKYFPFLKEDVFYKEEIGDVDMSEIKVKEIVPFIENMTMEDLSRMTYYKWNELKKRIVKKKEIKRKIFNVYFDDDGKYCLFIDSSKLAVYIDLESLFKRDFDEILNKDRIAQNMFIAKLSPEEQKERIEHPAIMRIKRYCEEGE